MSKDNTLIITHDIMTRLREHHSIENISILKDVGSQIEFKYVNKDVNDKKSRVLEGRSDVFNSFIDPEMH